MGTDGAGPSKMGYWVGAAAIAVGVLGAIVWGVLGFMSFASTVDDFQRVPANGQGEVTLDAGGHVIYFEAPDADSGDVPEGRVLVTAAGSDEPVTLNTYGSELSYNDGERAGLAVVTFDVETPGTYVVESVSDGEGELAIGPSVAGKLVSTVVGSLALGGFGVIAGAVILIVTFVRRRSARSRHGPWNAPPPGNPVYSPSPPRYDPPPAPRTGPPPPPTGPPPPQ